MTTPPDRLDDPDVVLRTLGRMRPRMPALLGTDWPSFRRRLDGLIARAAKAKPGERRRLLRLLVRTLLASPAADLFRTSLRPAAGSGRTITLHRIQNRPALPAGALGGLKVLDEETTRRLKSKAIRPTMRRSKGPGDRRGLVKKARGRPVKKGPSPTARREKARARKVAPARARSARPRPTQKIRPRVVNLVFLGPQRDVISRKKPLLVKQKYQLRVNIGRLARESVVRNAARNPVRADLLPENVEGHWLKIAAASSRFRVSETGRWLFLPNTGASFCCSCTPGGSHTCKPAARKRYLLLPAQAPESPGRAELRLTVYHRTGVVQSLLVTATVVATARARGWNHAVVDYNLTNRLTDLGAIEPRALSVMMNDSDDGTHRLIFNGAPDKPVTLILTDDQMTAALTMMRSVMRDIHIEKVGNAVTNRFDGKNAKSRKDFIADLEEAAARGWQLWTSVWGDRIDEWTDNEAKFVGASEVIQIARKQSSTSIFPWAMVYSIPIDTGAPENNRLCRLLDETEWKKFQAGTDIPTRCPFDAEHAEDVICPYGFWGFRYQIEQPPSLRPGRTRIVSIPAEPRPLDFVAALSQELDQPLLTAHLKALAAQHKNFTIQECRTRDTIRDGLGTRDLEVAYFYCHGNTDQLPGEAGTTPSLGVGKNEVINPPDLVRWVLKSWPKDHWKTIAPLVFINGCHTADTTPQTLVNFVDTFSASLKAAGVLGTEITLHQLVANEVGQTFLDAFQRGNGVGPALRIARTALLRKGNLLGLVYTAYCSADLKFSASVV